MLSVAPDNWPPQDSGEPCAFCKSPTHLWFRPKDVAVCVSCAEVREPEEVPSKRDWINANRRPGQAMLPEGWQCDADRRIAQEIGA